MSCCCLWCVDMMFTRNNVQRAVRNVRWTDNLGHWLGVHNIRTFIVVAQPLSSTCSSAACITCVSMRACVSVWGDSAGL